MTEMISKPTTSQELIAALSEASARKERVGRIDLTALNRVIECAPEDMTVTVEAGITLAALQNELAGHHQWLPIDPPNPAKWLISDVINENASGPRRFGYGTIRDYLIGIKVVLADGKVVCSGGKVVKNVAGYDLGKLFVGGRGSLGVVLEATFKLRPLPETERFVKARCKSLDEANGLIEAVLDSELTPVVFDLHQLAGGKAEAPVLVLGMAGTREEVDWQLNRAGKLGLSEPSSLDYENEFWTNPAPAHRLSVLPSKLAAAIRGLNGAGFIARAGNGIAYHRGSPASGTDPLPLELIKRVKDAFDPGHILPDLPL